MLLYISPDGNICHLGTEDERDIDILLPYHLCRRTVYEFCRRTHHNQPLHYNGTDMLLPHQKENAGINQSQGKEEKENYAIHEVFGVEVNYGC